MHEVTRRKITFFFIVKRKPKLLKDHTYIIGIDPGTVVLGYAVIRVDNKKNNAGEAIKIESLGVIQMKKEQDHYQRLKRISEKISFLMETYKPDEMAIEAPFLGKNVQSMLKLGRAQGVVISVGMVYGAEVTEYSPRKIKQSITGNGNASKEQISYLLKNMLKIDTMPKYFDATDALGVAVCHYIQTSSPFAKMMGGKKHKDWGSFIKDNPDRIKG